MSGSDSGNEASIRPTFIHRPVATGPLTEFVSELWYWQGWSLPQTVERILPWGTVELVINLNGSRSGASVVSGPHSKAFLVDRVLSDELVGVHFRPGGAFPFLEVPYADLHNVHVPTADIWGDVSADRLVSSVREAGSIDEKLDRVQRWLSGVAVRPLQHHPAVSSALRAFSAAPNGCSSAAMAAANNISQRRFIQRFHGEVGLTPKLFARIRRFHDVVARIDRSDEVDWASVALASGYCDQSHFNHDFREFCGLTPRRYLDLYIEEHPGHVRVR